MHRSTPASFPLHGVFARLGSPVLAGILLATACAPAKSAGTEERLGPCEGPRLVSRTNRAEAAAALVALLSEPGALPRMEESPDTMVALHATWERFRLGSVSIEEFLGGVETGTAVSVPEWWKEALRTWTVVTGGALLAGIRQGPPDVYVESVRGTVSMAPKFSNYPIVLERAGEVLWRNEIWAVNPPVIMGVHSQHVECVTTESLALVFGATSLGAYLEVFDLRTGDPCLRFSTNSWSEPVGRSR